jgi:hypothetical protein
MTKGADDGLPGAYGNLGAMADHDPFGYREEDADTGWMEDDDLCVFPDHPGSREMPAPSQREVFTPQRSGSVGRAIRGLIATNPGCREILLSIIDLSRDGESSSVINGMIDELQADNRTVYSPVSLCRMLERAGALRFELPEVSEEHEDVDEGVGYLTIGEDIDPVWRATEEGVIAYEELTRGDEWREVVFESDTTYAEVYLAVMRRMAEGPCGRQDINDLAGTFEITKHPRRFGTHFLDLLEKTSAARWTDHAWVLTDLGKRLLPELVEYCESRAQPEAGREREVQG